MITQLVVVTLTIGLFVAGAYHCGKAMKRTGNRGYGLLATYFILSAFLTVLGNLDDGADPTQGLLPEVTEDTPAEPVPADTESTSLPFMPLLLFAGVYMVLKDDPRIAPEEAIAGEDEETGAASDEEGNALEDQTAKTAD
ncbi:MAG: hypothetical protein KAI66_18770 [Lentisphaeria bacterium]|nr:hypothetical protein [Lentisphaeria bacterium]